MLTVLKTKLSKASILLWLLSSCVSDNQDSYEVAQVDRQTQNNYQQWRYDNASCVFKKEACMMDFRTVSSIDDFESWVIAFRTGGTKRNNFNRGFSLGMIDDEQALICTQSDTHDPGNNRRTEAKVVLAPVGDYRVAFDVYLDKVPKGFDTTISQIKCGSGKPPINIKITDGGGVRVKSGGKHALSRTPGYFKQGWHSVVYTIENSRKTISLTIDGKALKINNDRVVTDCRDIKRAGKDYYLKIGLYEDDVVPGFWIAYRNLNFTYL